MANIVSSFSYNVRDMDFVEKGKQTAEDLGISFSQYLMKCMKADIGDIKNQKKVMGQDSNRSPIKANLNDINEEEEYKVTPPPINSRSRKVLLEFIKSVNSTQDAGTIQGNGIYIHNMAKERIRQLNYMRISK